MGELTRAQRENWFHRVFGTNDAPVSPEALLEHVCQSLPRPPATYQFQGDDQGWFRADLDWQDREGPLTLHRYLATEEGIRADLNAWAAWLEVNAPDAETYMQRLIRTTQLFTFRSPPWGISPFTFNLCKFLAGQTDGFIQIDGVGFYTADGNVIVRESA
jgi:hypothetical protein